MKPVKDRYRGRKIPGNRENGQGISGNWIFSWYKPGFLSLNDIKKQGGLGHPVICCREDRIRTCDPLVPNQVRYRPALLPERGSKSRDLAPPVQTLPAIFTEKAVRQFDSFAEPCLSLYLITNYYLIRIFIRIIRKFVYLASNDTGSTYR